MINNDYINNNINNIDCMSYKIITHIYIYTIVDLLCKNGFLRAISYQRRSLRCEMRWEIHFEQNKKKQKTIVYLLWICQGQYDVNIASC